MTWNSWPAAPNSRDSFCAVYFWDACHGVIVNSEVCTWSTTKVTDVEVLPSLDLLHALADLFKSFFGVLKQVMYSLPHPLRIPFGAE